MHLSKAAGPDAHFTCFRLTQAHWNKWFAKFYTNENNNYIEYKCN